jgi:hypothetical protein
MHRQQREVPLSYTDLHDMINDGVFPAERYWLDFKRELYTRPAAAPRGSLHTPPPPVPRYRLRGSP